MTPTQELVMEVLAARTRLGEAFWTFRSRHAFTLRQLEALGMVETMHGNVDNTIRAKLTEQGRAAFLSPSYTLPS
jgi:hypothetical protein